MRKLLFTTVLFLACISCSELWAQKGLKLGGIVYPSVSYMLNPDDANLNDSIFQYSVLPSMAAGINLGWNPSDNFGIRLNILYGQGGGRHTFRKDFLLDRVDTTLRTEYLKIPLMIGLHSNSFQRKLMMSFYVGGQLNYLTRAFEFNSSVAFEPPLPPNITDYPDSYAQLNTLTYSAIADFGLDIFLVDDYTLNIHLRGEYGLVDAENKNATYRLTTGGQTREVPFYNNTRAATTPLNVGITIGLTRTFTGRQNTGIPGVPIP